MVVKILLKKCLNTELWLKMLKYWLKSAKTLASKFKIPDQFLFKREENQNAVY